MADQVVLVGQLLAVEQAQQAMADDNTDEPIPQPPRKRRRRCRRGTVVGKTSERVHAETWLTICQNLFFSPHTVFRLMLANKDLYQLLSSPACVEWWEKFYQRIQAYQQCLEHSNYRASLCEFQASLTI